MRFLKRLRRKVLPGFAQARPSFSRAEIDEVLASYDLGTWVPVREIKGGNSSNFIVGTASGKRVLKRYYGLLSRINVEHFVLNYLSRLSFPCPRLERNVAGATATSIGRKHYAVYQFIEGDIWQALGSKPGLRMNAIPMAARLLGRLDRALAELPLAQAPAELREENSPWPGDLNQHLDIIDQYADHISRSIKRRIEREERMRWSRDLSSGIVQAWRYYAENKEVLPRQVVHYDYAPKNLLFKDGEIAAVLDFGEIRRDFRASDVTRALTSFAGGESAAIDWHVAAVFLKEYQAEQPLQVAEIEAMEILMRWRVLISILGIAEISLKPNEYLQQSGLYLNPEVFIRRKWVYLQWLNRQREPFQGFLLAAGQARSREMQREP